MPKSFCIKGQKSNPSYKDAIKSDKDELQILQGKHSEIMPSHSGKN